MALAKVAALVSMLALVTPRPARPDTAPPSPVPARLSLDPGVLARLRTLAAGLRNEIVLCLTGSVRGSTAIATGFTMPDPQLSTLDRASFGPCPGEAVAIWHNHPLEEGIRSPSADATGYARPRGDPNVTPRDLCALSETDIRSAAAGGLPFVVVGVDADTWCWWSRDQVRKLAARNAARGDPVPGQIESRSTR